MALIQTTYFSKALSRNVTFTAVIPAPKMVFPGMPAPEKKPFKTLYLLHGILGNHADWSSCSRIRMLAEEKNLAVMMPSGENSFYVDDEVRGNMFGEFIGVDLVEATREIFKLSDKREDTYIAGLSMGGYGAIRNGLKYCDTFSHVAGLSSALITYQAPELQRMLLGSSGKGVTSKQSLEILTSYPKVTRTPKEFLR